MRRWRVPVLMYHHVEPHPLEPPAVNPDSYLTPEALARHLDLLRRLDFVALTLAEALERHGAGQPLPRRCVVLTFDDGCRCFLDHAYPEIEKRGMTATLYVVSGKLGGGNDWDEASGERRERLLDAEPLRRHAAAGVEIGCHGYSHADVTRCDPQALGEEIAGSRHCLMELADAPVRTFCYPYGKVDPRASEAVRGAGYLGAVSIHGELGADRHNLYALPRMIIRPKDSSFEFLLKASGLYPAWSRVPRLGLLAALRRNRRHP